MVILSANGFQDKDKCGELLKIIKNKKVFVCTNAIERELYKKKIYQTAKDNIDEVPSRFDGGDLNLENVYRYLDYYDCIYLAGGSLNLLSDMLSVTEMKEALLKFINKGKIFITQGLSSLIAVENLEYLNFIVNCLSEENKLYPHFNYSSIKTLSLTKDKIVFCPSSLPKVFQGACKIAEKQNRISLTYLKDNEFIVL